MVAWWVAPTVASMDKNWVDLTVEMMAGMTAESLASKMVAVRADKMASSSVGKMVLMRAD